MLSHWEPSPTPEYHAIAANFAPKPGDGLGGVFKRIGDKIVDTCFEEENDLVVPTLGGSHRRDTEKWIAFIPSRVHRARVRVERSQSWLTLCCLFSRSFFTIRISSLLRSL
jgi:hypothetical protein